MTDKNQLKLKWIICFDVKEAKTIKVKTYTQKRSALEHMIDVEWMIFDPPYLKNYYFFFFFGKN